MISAASSLHWLALLVEAGSGAVLAVQCVRAVLLILRGEGAHRVRLVLADGAVMALSLKTGAALLKTLDMPSLDALGRFLAILALRIALKRAFAAERRWLLRQEASVGARAA